MRLALVLLMSSMASAQLPNPRLTPGAVRTEKRAEICSPAFRAQSFRRTTYAMKKQVCRAYGVKRCPKAGEMEIDHLIPIELGGADVVINLWPEFAKYANGGPGFHEKDRLENYLHAEVCAHRMALSDAQRCIGSNWVSCSKQVGKP